MRVSTKTVNSFRQGRGLMFLDVLHRADAALCTSQGPGRVCFDSDSHTHSFNRGFRGSLGLVALGKNRMSVFPVTQNGKSRVILVY